ncbi:MAG: translation initiation factor IF-2 N-terminal domain-containing protein, partial [Acidimicrobiia bacterium]|nr:translation initiation factor IF-2 N-terminal domain-containing protein [Acidimicrobiia bacterium]
MPAKVRVYELARQLGMSNAEILDLCASLGIGAKSHSSSIVEAQADRLRRKAEREGLTRDPIPEPEEDKPVKKAAAKKKAAKKKPPPRKKAAAKKAAPTATPEEQTPAATAPKVASGAAAKLAPEPVVSSGSATPIPP